MDGYLVLLFLQGFRKRHMNVLGPAVSPTVANGIVTQVRADFSVPGRLANVVVCRKQWHVLFGKVPRSLSGRSLTAVCVCVCSALLLVSRSAAPAGARPDEVIAVDVSSAGPGCGRA